MTKEEATNIILALTREGWTPEKINKFISFIETHKPSEDEVNQEMPTKYKFEK